ncbi:hypothetical protein NQ176_g6805 [Zarea fungicola]|uniref:Uncharacterized protein n=1 Tax=Zarea fungicola TaxID=93591 RepID=A0ACC1N1E5_9HYPO|nr:hypothetical protein NQ176_g6805 [Lecanicillium fungicola]
MRLSVSILTLCGSSLVAAAVTLSGNGGPAKDHIECESITVGDFELADLLEEVILRNASRSDTEFVFNTNLDCNSTLAQSIEALCFTMPYTVATCLPSAPSQRHSPDTRNVKRDFPEYCKVDGTCTYTKEYEAAPGSSCAKGYVFGHLTQHGDGGTYVTCQMPCTDDEKTRCTQASCDFHRLDCSTTGGVSIAACGKALKDCSDPVAMGQSICNDELISIPAKMNCTGCVSYHNGKCVLDRAKYNTAYGNLETKELQYLRELANSNLAEQAQDHCEKNPSQENCGEALLAGLVQVLAQAAVNRKGKKH